MEDLASSSDATVEHNTKNLMEHDKGKFNFTDGLGSVSCSEKFVTRDELSVREMETDKLQSEVPLMTMKICNNPIRGDQTPNAEDSLGELKSASSRSFFTQDAYGESNFSNVDNPTALVTRSGWIAYSSSISLRSDSSTTSSRSFAFPILQSDWHFELM
ncbi:hypothetical protein MKX01_037234 [Papaver californicum]|nr:hypothetical protein MKX01_037234 [Papaver californicum]